MKIFYYINVLCNGGAERVISNLANMMSSKGHECFLITSYQTDNEYQVHKSVVRYTLVEHPIEGFLKRNVTLTYKLRQLIKKEQPDLIVAFMAEPNFRACLSTVGLKTKTVISVRNDPHREYRGPMGLLSKLLFRLADGIVFQTEEAKSFFPTTISNMGVIIFNSVRDDFFRQQPYDAPSGIVTTGRLTSQKNHKLLIDAYSKIADTVEDELTIYGSGDPTELLNYVKQLGLEAKVHIPGAITDVPGILKKYKLFVLSSDYEGMPNALMEAMALGLACISTDCPCGGPKMLFSEYMQQYLSPVRDVNRLAELMQKILHDDKERVNLATEAKRQALLFHPSVIDGRWESFLNQISRIE